MKQYIEITQDGIGRILRHNGPDEFIGLYTEKIETCLIILIVSNKGVSLIHNTGKIRVEDIVDEFKWHENIAFWTVAYNPRLYPEKYKSEDLQKRLGEFISAIEETIGDNKHMRAGGGVEGMKLIEASQGFVTISKSGRIEVEAKPAAILQCEDIKSRHGINTINNLFLDYNEHCPADFQFDGFGFTPSPRLYKSPEEIEKFASTPRFQAYEHIKLALIAYHEIYKNELADQPLNLGL